MAGLSKCVIRVISPHLDRAKFLTFSNHLFVGKRAVNPVELFQKEAVANWSACL